MFDPIVVATDLTNRSAVAGRFGHALASRFEADVVVTYVVPDSVANWASGAYDILEDPANFARAERRVAQWYRDLVADAPRHVDLRVGTPTEELRTSSRLHSAALLVVAMSRKSAATRLFLGSTARSLAANPPCPVVIAHPDFEALHAPLRLVVGCDFSANSHQAIRYAARLAAATPASLHIVHANTVPHLAAQPDASSHQAWAARQMRATCERLQDDLSGVDYDDHILTAAPARGLIDFVEDHDADLLVVGGSGQSQVEGAVLGSVTNTLIESMPCSTLVAPPLPSRSDAD